jgi:hypothetical protein
MSFYLAVRGVLRTDSVAFYELKFHYAKYDVYKILYGGIVIVII